MRAGTDSLFRLSDALESGLCHRMNRGVNLPWFREYCRIVSRLGNGVIWYTMLAAMPLVGGLEVLPETVHVGLTALAGVAIYKLCKKLLQRERPFVTHSGISCVGRPLDRGSFPSGHTIHAVSFTIMLGTLYPAMLWMLLPLAMSIAVSRVVVGHHYPSDVVMGGLIGWGLASASLALLPYTAAL